MKKIPNYQLIDSLVANYQNGSKDSASELIDMFSPYINKYIKMLKENIIDLNNKDSRFFILLFVSDAKLRKQLHRSKQPSEARKAAYDALSFINKTCTLLTEEDITQELIMILLILAKRYKQSQGKNFFTGYVYNVFRYELFRRVIEITGDPLTFSAVSNLNYNDEENEEDNNFTNDPNLHIEVAFIDSEDNVLDYNWEQGHTCSEEFLELTTFERKILKMSYQDGFDDKAIGERVGMHRHTIRTRKKEAIDKVRSYYENL